MKSTRQPRSWSSGSPAVRPGYSWWNCSLARLKRNVTQEVRLFLPCRHTCLNRFPRSCVAQPLAHISEEVTANRPPKEELVQTQPTSSESSTDLHPPAAHWASLPAFHCPAGQLRFYGTHCSLIRGSAPADELLQPWWEQIWTTRKDLKRKYRRLHGYPSSPWICCRTQTVHHLMLRRTPMFTTVNPTQRSRHDVPSLEILCQVIP